MKPDEIIEVIRYTLAANKAISNSHLAAMIYGKLLDGGLAIVPVEPTEAMIKAGVAYRLRTTISSENNWPTDTAGLFRAMIAVEG